MKFRRICSIFCLTLVLAVSGCGGEGGEQGQDGKYRGPVNIVGDPDRGMSQKELIDAANKQISTHIIGNLEVGPNKHNIPLRWVGMWTQENAATEEQFVIGLGRTMRAMSASTNVEFCAQVCKQGTTWGAAILTIDSGRYCPATKICPSEKWKAEGHPIHSHRRSGPYQMTPQDEALRTGELLPSREIHLAADRASKEDTKQAGWLVGQDALWFIDQSGNLVPVWDYERDVKGPPVRMMGQFSSTNTDNSQVGSQAGQTP